MLSILFPSILACGGDVNILPDKTSNDTFDPIEEPSDNDSAMPEEEPLTDFLQRGPYEVLEESRAVGVTGCPNMNYSVYSPIGVVNPPVVVLGHGFARGADKMTGWADHLSSWGVEVLLPTLCHYNVFAGVDHELNGKNMTELAVSHGAVEVVYAGHSAGGLAAIIAASQDGDAFGVLGLDTTDTKDVPGVPNFIGQQYAGAITCPGFSVMGEQSSCNADNNGLDLFRMIENRHIIKVNSADHCDFEKPTDFICEMNCENSTTVFSDEEIRPIILTLGTAAVMSLTGLSADGTLVWTESGLKGWIDEGKIEEIE